MPVNLFKEQWTFNNLWIQTLWLEGEKMIPNEKKNKKKKLQQ